MNHRTPLIIALCGAAFLSGCFNERSNPLLEKPNQEVVHWLFKNTNAEIESCAKSWADPKTASASELNGCESVAQKLTEEINYVGFAQDVRVEDLNIPIVWHAFHEKITKRNESNARIEADKKDPNSLRNMLGVDRIK